MTRRRLAFPVAAGGSIILAAAASWLLSSRIGIDAVALARWLGRRGHPVYGAVVLWTVVAPLFLATAAAVARWNPWPWVAAMTLHLVVVVGMAGRLAHLTPGWLWAGIGLAVSAGLVSIATVIPYTHRRRSMRKATKLDPPVIADGI